jgi:hypothetical protein
VIALLAAASEHGATIGDGLEAIAGLGFILGMFWVIFR